MIKKNLAAAILWATMLVFRAHASEPPSLTFENFPDDIMKVIFYHTDPADLYRFAFVSKGSTVLVQKELQRRVPDLIEQLYKLPVETSAFNLLRQGGFYRTPAREKEDKKLNVPSATIAFKLPTTWDYQQFQAEFEELFLLKEMELFRRRTLQPKFQDLFAYVKPMISVAVLSPNTKGSLYLGVQAAYILLTKPQLVLCPSIDDLYFRKKDHQRTYLTLKTVKTIENICTRALSQKTLHQLFDMCYGMIATARMYQSPLRFDDVRAAGRALTKINLEIHYPDSVHTAFLEAIVSAEIIVYPNGDLSFTKMGNNTPRTVDEKRADLMLLYQVQTHQYIPYIEHPYFSNAKASQVLNNDALFFIDEEFERFKHSAALEKLFQ